MVGLIVTGHGSFASGMASALQFICGRQEHIAFVDFNGQEDQFHLDVASAIASLAGCEEIAFLCDLRGGTPFKYAATLAAADPGKYAVAYGVNLPSLAEAALARDDCGQAGASALLSEVLALLPKQVGILSVSMQTDDDDE